MKTHCKYDELVEINKLKSHPKNRNKHPKDQIARLAEILKYQGWRYPVKVSKRSGFVTSGHGRIKSARLNKWKKVPVNYQDYESDDQEYADVLSDNAIATWAELDLSAIDLDIENLASDFDISLLGLKNFEIEPTGKYADKTEEEDNTFPDRAPARVKLGQIWQLGKHRLMCGDAIKISNFNKLSEHKKLDFCFTSPPYSDQRDYEGGTDLDPKYLSKFLISKCNLFSVNLGLQRKNNQINRYWDEYLKTAESVGLKLLSWNIWDKGEAGSIGMQTAIFPIEHEWIFIFGKERTKLNKIIPCKRAKTKSTANTRREKDGSLTKVDDYLVGDFKTLGTVSRVTPQKARNLDSTHPAMFPVGLPEQYILSCTNQDDSVYEPFGGSGTTLIACEKTNRKCYMMEIEPKYCDVIVKRWEDYTGLKAKKAGK